MLQRCYKDVLLMKQDLTIVHIAEKISLL